MKNPYYDFEKISLLTDVACSNLEGIFDALGLNIKYNGRIFVGCCPIHNGDNGSAFNLYPNGDVIKGNWKCRTHNCQEKHGKSLISFIKAYMGVSWKEAVDWLSAYLKIDIITSKICSVDTHKLKIIQSNRFHLANKVINKNLLCREKVRSILQNIPSSYMQKRGISEEILNHFDVGDCTNPYKRMYNRAVFPIYDNSYQNMVGCVGRSIYEECDKCKSYHDKTKKCPETDYEKFKCVKWLASKNFNPKNYIYNFWNIKKRGLEKCNNTVILVEGCGDVLKMEESGILNSVAIFGTEIIEQQIMNLECLNVNNIIIFADNDKNNAGINAAKLIQNNYNRIFNISIKLSEYKDAGDSSVEYLQDIFKEFINV